MVQVKKRKVSPPTVIKRFLGLNEDVDGETGLKLGESPNMTNWRITDNYKLRKREGYDDLFASIAAKDIQGMWYGKISGNFHFLFACNGAVYDKTTISSSGYDSLDTSTYANVDVIKTTAISPAIVGTTGIDNITIIKNKLDVQLTEIAQADINNASNVGKFYYHTDKTIWFIVAKGAYVDIAAARTGLGTTTVYYKFGTLTDAKTFMFAFNDKVYFQNANEYKSWNGTTFAVVTGYRPKVFIGTPPAGGGTAFEEVNLLTGEKHQTFNGNGAATEYLINEKNVTSIDFVKVDGVLKTVTTDYTVDLVNGKVIPVVPANFTTGQDNIDIGWTKGTGDRDKVQKNKKALIFGGANESRIHIFGNATLKNRIYFSGLADGVPSAEYFPEGNFNDVGSDEFSITDMVRQYDRALIFKENETWYTFYESVTISNVTTATFPCFTLNQEYGNVAFGQAQLINNNPFTVDQGIYEWIATTVRDERNAKYLSLRIQPSLDAINLTLAITFDWQEKGEYWICVGTEVIVYAYRIDVWYKFTNISAKCFIVIDGEMYFGNGNGQIMKFNTDQRNDNGTAIVAEWEMSFYDFETDWLRKYINRLWMTLKPETRARVFVRYETDRNSSSEVLEAVYNFATFTHANFTHFSFKTNYNPQPFRFKIKAKKFVYFKLILTADTIDETATVLTIDLNSRYGGEAK